LVELIVLVLFDPVGRPSMLTGEPPPEVDAVPPVSCAA
jgi:hypothetical protein